MTMICFCVMDVLEILTWKQPKVTLFIKLLYFKTITSSSSSSWSWKYTGYYASEVHDVRKFGKSDIEF